MTGEKHAQENRINHLRWNNVLCYYAYNSFTGARTMIIISKTYEVVTPESAEYGEAEERGFEFENMPYTFRELVEELKEYPYPSCSHGVPSWVSSYPETDYITGEETTYSLHPGRDNRSQRYWEKACRAAGLIK